MNSTRFLPKNFPLLPVYIGVGVGVGISAYCAFRARQRRNTFLARTRRQAEDLARQMAEVGALAADLLEKGREQIERQSKGLADAVEAGKKAFQRSVA
jgi:shikimate 5-dehydrogenase